MGEWNDFFEGALFLASKGWRVHPLRPREKVPALKAWPDLATTDPATITRWWAEMPDANVGVVTGPESGLVILDVDTGKGGDASYDDLVRAHGHIPDTVSVQTGSGGYHYYFRHPGALTNLRNSAGMIAEGIDVRAWHGFAVAPPSIHPNGKPYTWMTSGDPREVEVAMLPTWLVSLMLQRQHETSKATAVADVIPEGQRHGTMVSIAGTMRRRGLSAPEILAALTETNRLRCTPPMDADELRAISEKVERYPANPLEVTADTAMAETVGQVYQDGGKKYKVTRREVKEGAPSSGKLDGTVLQSTLETDVPRWLADRDLTTNAIGEWVKASTWEMTGATTPGLAREYANHFRRSRQYVSVSYVQEVMEEISDGAMATRRDYLNRLVLANAQAGDDAELRRWVEAVAGEEGGLYLLVMKQWLWQVKRAVASLPVDNHLMPILLGPQSSGKSTAAHRLCSHLRELARVPAPGDMLTDSRWTPALGKYCAAVWDEMEGADRANMEALKRTITAPSLTYRPMKSNSTASIIVRTQWIGTTNRPVAGMIRDTTGNRRFFEIQTLKVCDWETINQIDYAKVWAAVSHTEECPIVPHLARLRAAQLEQRYMDTAAAWLSAEDWGAFLDDDGITRQRVEHTRGVTAVEMFARYRAYCRRFHEEHMLSNIQVGVRLCEEGWHKRRDSEGTRPWRYYPPESDSSPNPAPF